MANDLELLKQSSDGPASLAEIKQGVNLIQQVLRGVMKRGTHYDVIPGCGTKPALLKPGAEKILATFRISANPDVEDLSSSDEIRYRVKVEGKTPGGLTVGFGVGECSSNEEKYKWRAAVSPKEFEATPEDRRRVKYFKDGREFNQIRMQPADIANTVLKMAKKRALVDLCLTATAASDCFTQDLDEMEPEVAQAVAGDAQGREPIKQPERASAKTKPAMREPGDESENDLSFDDAAIPPPERAKPDISACQTVVGDIADVSLKEGAGAKGPWKKFGVQMGREYYGTFDWPLGEWCVANQKSGKVRLFWVLDSKNPKYKNLIWAEPA